MIGVTEESVYYWETNRAKPMVHHIPKIIEFLGYNPYPVEAETLGGRIKSYRLEHGLSHKRLGELLGWMRQLLGLGKRMSRHLNDRI
jgi:DNA-binding XRE family transcriptional regulator